MDAKTLQGIRKRHAKDAEVMRLVEAFEVLQSQVEQSQTTGAPGVPGESDAAQVARAMGIPQNPS